MIRLLSLSFAALLAITVTRAADEAPFAPILQNLVDKHIVPGVVTLVADKDHVLDLEVAGYSRLSTKAPMKTDSMFYIASMTKSFTGAALMMLVDEGKVSLDDPVEKYLPEFKGQMVVENKQPPRPPKHPITVREIMCHTSGVAATNDPRLKHTFTLKETVAQIAALRFCNGSRGRSINTNTGINTGARLVEVLSGMVFTDFLQQRIFTPLGLSDTTYWPTEEQAQRLAYTALPTADKSGLEDTLHAKDLTPEVREKFGQGVKVPQPMLDNFGQDMLFTYSRHYGEGAHGICSTASDIGRFCQMLLNGGTWQGHRYLSEAAVKQMSTIQTGVAETTPDEAYGIGVFVTKKDNRGPSAGSFGHLGSHKTNMWVDPKNQLVMVMMVQVGDLTKEQEKELYEPFFKAAVAKYGRKQ